MSTLLLDRSEILTRIPHQGDMCLLDGVIRCDAQSIDCIAHIKAGRLHALRDSNLTTAARVPNHADNTDKTNHTPSDGRVSIVHSVEYAAQAAALHIGLAANFPGTEDTPHSKPAPVKQGVLAHIKNLTAHTLWLNSGFAESANNNSDSKTSESPAICTLIISTHCVLSNANSWIYSFSVAEMPENDTDLSSKAQVPAPEPLATGRFSIVCP